MKNGVFIIAEAGVNHNGDIGLAKQLIDAAAESGANAVKFQTFISEKIVSRSAGKANYQKETTDSDESQIDMLRRLELRFQDFRELKRYCEQKGIMFLSTAFDICSADFLYDLGLPLFKIPSGEITNYPLLKAIGQFKKRVIMSTGMSELKDIEAAINVLKEQGTSDIILLHCNTQYPTPFSDVNLRAMNELKKHFGLPVGYSDHTKGIEVPIAAAALGAVVIEKHFTLDNNMEWPDHKASLEPDELAKMVASIRNIEMALGSGMKTVTDSERENIAAARKSIVAAAHINKGEVLTDQNLTVKRPGTGISPMRWTELIGRIADRDYEEDEMIEL